MPKLPDHFQLVIMAGQVWIWQAGKGYVGEALPFETIEDFVLFTKTHEAAFQALAKTHQEKSQ